jgi:transcription elongation factor Elf1
MKPSINNLDNLTKCPICNKKYGQSKILVLEEEMNRTTLHVTCGNCKISSLVFISSGKMGIVSLGILTDLTQEEAKKLFKGEEISSDNVIEAHEYLKNFKGGISEFI